MWDKLKTYRDDKKGGFAIAFALASTFLLMSAAVAIEFANLESQKQKTQNYADLAALAAANYMSEHISELDSDANFKKYSSEAKKFSTLMIRSYLDNDSFDAAKPTFYFTDTDVKVDLSIRQKTMFMGAFGYKDLEHNVSATANLAVASAKDVDVALIADATGSMATTLTGIQTNMKDFTFDLQTELDKYNVELGTVRVKFFFYRDYMVDNHINWTGRDMDPLPGMEIYGPMYESRFYELPIEKTAMDNYVDFFQAGGGGTFKESGFEAIWHAIKASNWGAGEDTVRSIVLWTDASPRPFGDTEEVFGLTPNETGYWNNAYWDMTMGPTFTALTYEQRQQYMIDNYYPDKAPKSLGSLKGQFEEFHAENANGKPDVNTMAVNIVSDCWGVDPCGEWENVKAWEGVDFFEEATVTSDETYDAIIKQVANTVLTQLAARDLALTH